MAFRGRGTAIVTTGAPTASIDIGDPFLTGGAGLAADAQHQHAFPAPPGGYVTEVGSLLNDGALTAAARADHAHRIQSLLLAPGGSVDLSAIYGRRPAVGDGVQYVAAGGNDTQDGLTFGSAKATVAAAVAALPAGGGHVYVGAGIFDLTGPVELTHVVIEGRGLDVTFLRRAAASWAPFANNFLLQPPGEVAANSTDVAVRNLTLDGNARAGGGGVDQAGLIALGHRWVVENVRFYDSNWFAVWAFQTNDSTVRRCRFATKPSAYDNVGGGSNTGLAVCDNDFDAGIVGSAITQTNGAGYVLWGNRNLSTSAIVLEGCTDSTIALNSSMGSIRARSDSGYGHTTVIMPRAVVILANQIDGAGAIDYAIQVTYDGAGDPAPKTPGGGNVVALNRLRNLRKVGVIIDAGAAAHINQPDQVVLNQVENTNTDGTTTWNTGLAVVQNAGICLAAGKGSLVAFNIVADTQGVPTTRYGVNVGGSPDTAGVADVLVTDNTALNTVAGAVITFPAVMTGTNRIKDNPGYNPLGHAVTQPAVPASTVAAANTTGVDCTVFVTGGTVTAIAVGGTATGLTSGSFRVPAGQTITLTYTVAPTWQWFGD